MAPASKNVKKSESLKQFLLFQFIIIILVGTDDDDDDDVARMKENQHLLLLLKGPSVHRAGLVPLWSLGRPVGSHCCVPLFFLC